MCVQTHQICKGCNDTFNGSIALEDHLLASQNCAQKYYARSHRSKRDQKLPVRLQGMHVEYTPAARVSKDVDLSDDESTEDLLKKIKELEHKQQILQQRLQQHLNDQARAQEILKIVSPTDSDASLSGYPVEIETAIFMEDDDEA